MIARSLALLSDPRRAALAAALLAAVLTAPSLALGWVQDDLTLFRMATEPADLLGPHAPWDLFRFYTDPELVARMRDGGIAPWWTVDELRLAFFRPLASLWHAAEFAVFGQVAWPQHLASVALYAAAAVAVGWVYRRFEPDPRVAGLATVMWAVDDAHGMPVGWLANRNAVLAWALGAVALALHDRWRRDGWRAGGVAAPAVAALALGAGESALGVWAYFLSYALFLDRGGASGRVASVVPYGAVLVGWRIATRLGGYGTAGSAFYVDPTTDPLGFVAQLPIRLTVLAGAQLGPVPADAWMFAPAPARPVLFVLAAATVAGAAVALAPGLGADRLGWFWAFGALVSAVPMCATFPSERLLGFVGIGAFAVVARACLAPGTPRPVVLGWLGVHLALAIPMLPLRAVAVGVPGAQQRAAAASLPDTRGEVVVVAAPDWFVPTFGAVHRVVDGEAPMSALRLLVSGTVDEATRVDPRTLELASRAGFLRDPLASVVRDRPLVAGEVLEVGGWRIEIRETAADGAPTRIAFTAPTPLDDPRRTWTTWDGERLVPWDVP